MVRTFHLSVTHPDKKDTDSEAEPDGSSVPMRVSVSGEAEEEGEDADVEVDRGGRSNASADGESNTDGRSMKKQRGTYMKDGPTVYKLVKPVLKVIKDAKARE